MGSENVRFDAVVIAAAGGVFGVAYLLGAMLALLTGGHGSVLLLADSVAITTTVGILLALMAGLLSTGNGYGRRVGMMAFGLVVVFGRPSFASPEPFAVLQTGFALLVVVYVTFRNPVPKQERSYVDESTSATRVGSTLR